MESHLEHHRGKHFVGRLEHHVKGKGWFFGAFADEPLLRADLVEVAWQQLPNVSPSPEQEHFHCETVEINMVITDWIELTIDGTRYRLEAREFYVVWPESTVSDITTGPDTELIVVRAPSVPDDKVQGHPS